MLKLSLSAPQWLMLAGESGLLVVTIVFLIFAIRHTVTWFAFGSVMALFIASGFTTAGAWIQSNGPTPPPPVVPTAEIDQPVRESDATRKVAMCTQFGGTMVAVPGYQLVVGTREVDGSRWYFESDVDSYSTPSGMRFSVSVELGDSEDKDGHAYRVLPVYVPSSEVHDLVSTNDDPNDTFWGGYDVPDNSIRGLETTVVRSGHKACD